MGGDTETSESSSSTAAGWESSHRKRAQKFDVYEEISKKLKALDNEEASQPGFEDELWNHFNRFSVGYATDVNVERPEDVIKHMKLLHLAEDPNTRPAFEVRILRVPVSNLSCDGILRSMRNGNPQTSDGSTRQKQDNNRPTYAFGLPPSLERALKAKESNGQGGGDGDGEQHFFRHFYEITISTVDKPKLLSQFTSLLTEIGLNIQEAHAFSTSDGYSLDVFIVDGWSSEDMEQLKDVLEREILKIENLSRSKNQFKLPLLPPRTKDVNIGNERIASCLKIKQTEKALQEARLHLQLLEKEHALAVQEDFAVASDATSSLQ